MTPYFIKTRKRAATKRCEAAKGKRRAEFIADVFGLPDILPSDGVWL